MTNNSADRTRRNRRAGAEAIAWARPHLQAPETFTLSSPAFETGSPMPRRFRGRLLVKNISPELAWTPTRDGTASLILIVEDPDVPVGAPAVHAIAALTDPSVHGIPEGGLGRPSSVKGLLHGRGVLGRRSWAGPMPPRSHGPHDYVFQLFALDYVPELAEGFTLDQASAAMTGHLVARARLTGTYASRSGKS